MSAIGWRGGRRVDALVVGSVVVHLLVALAHGVGHALIPVHLLWWQSLLVASSVVAGPLLGAGLVVSGRVRAGGAVLAASFGVAFWVELLAHFVLQNPDHVGHVHRAQRFFAGTAALAVLTDAVGGVVGLGCWRGSLDQ